MTRDLVVLVADAQQETVINTLLQERCQSLGIRANTFDIEKHPGKDSGVYSRGVELLSVIKPLYDHALVLIDCE